MLIKCPECGHEVSSYADACPHCGCNIQRAIEQKDAIDELAPYAYRRIMGLILSGGMFGMFAVLTLILGICSACNMSEVLNRELAPWMFTVFVILALGSAGCLLLGIYKYKSLKKVVDL